MSNSIEILSHTAELSYAGAKAKGDGYYNTSDGLHTVAFYLKDFLGRIHLEGSLVTDPTASDWFAIPIGSGTDYKEYTAQTTITEAFNFTNNAVWVRARVDRSAVAGNPTVYDQSLHGTVEKVLLNT